MFMGGPVRALIAGVLIPIAPWLLIQQPWFGAIPVSVQGFHEVFERLACGQPQDLQALVVACLLGAFFGGLLSPRAKPKTP
jgi:hypothetical protein